MDTLQKNMSQQVLLFDSLLEWGKMVNNTMLPDRLDLWPCTYDIRDEIGLYLDPCILEFIIYIGYPPSLFSIPFDTSCDSTEML